MPWEAPYESPFEDQPPYGEPKDTPSTLLGFMFLGVVLYSLFNVIVGFLVITAAIRSEAGSSTYLITGTTVLAITGLGLGAGLCFVRSPWTRGLGLGLMMGWALWSLLSVGYGTGINPSLYG